jgi:hypothetical protein
MFRVYCPSHQSNVLLGPRRIRGLANTRGVIIVELECYDGELLESSPADASTRPPGRWLRAIERHNPGDHIRPPR